MHRSTLPAAFTLSMNSIDFKVSTYHGVLVSLRNVLHFCNEWSTVDGFGGGG